MKKVNVFKFFAESIAIAAFVAVIVSCALFTGGESLEEASEIEVPEVTDCDWLFMIYLDGDNNLNDYLFLNLLQCEYGLYLHDRNSPDVKLKILVLWDGLFPTDDKTASISHYHPGSALYELGYRTSAPDSTTDSISNETKNLTFFARNWIKYDDKEKTLEADMGDPDTLRSFLSFASKAYNAKKSVLLISNHGAGPYSATASASSSSRLVCVDSHNPNASSAVGYDALDTNKISPAILSGWGRSLDCLMFDACLCGSVESLYEFKDCTEYMVASPNNIPGYGYPYSAFIGGNFSSGQEEEALCIGTVCCYADFYSSCITGTSSFDQKTSSSPTLSAYRASSSKLEELKKAMDAFALDIEDDATLIAEGKGMADLISGYLYPKNEAGSSLMIALEDTKLEDVECLWYQGTFNSLVDIGFLADKYHDDESNQGKSVASDAEKLQDILEEVVLYSWRGDSLDTSSSVTEGTTGLVTNKGLYPLLNSSGRNYYGLTVCSGTLSENAQKPVRNIGFSSDDYRRSSSFGASSEWGNLLEVLF